jgi:WhiB family transcriptional regulator, redox-sensing transcriptional regulator
MTAQTLHTVAVALSGLDWTEDAECRFVNAEVFFPPPENHLLVKAAKKVCRHCPVRRQCLDEALSVAPTADHGIWGGTTPGERRGLRSRGRAAQ